ncbi:MAG: glycosyltransferase [Limnothrix sp. RL_2_0]|nr:glycosyltransferase [Limnothrix sp. RL_2_0]
MNNKVLIYADLLLPYSATFISQQVNHLRRYESKYFGTILQEPLPFHLSTEQIFAYENIRKLTKIDRGWIKLTGKLPPNIISQFEQKRPDLIHAHFGPDALWALSLKKRLKIPLITTIHSPDSSLFSFNTRLSYKYYLLNRSKLFKDGDKIIAVSEFIKTKLLAAGCPEEKIFLHYIGIDIEKISPNLSILREDIVLYVGRLVEYKGCDYLIRAMSAIQTFSPQTKLIVIGDGPKRHDLEILAQTSNVDCQFLGIQPPQKVWEWMNRSKVFCMPSFTTDDGHSEAFGMVFAEAQAMKLPVVSFKSGGISEVVIHGQTGFLAEEKNLDQLSSYILKLLQDTGLWNQFSQNARDWVIQKFDIKKQTAILEDFYDSVLIKAGH